MMFDELVSPVTDYLRGLQDRLCAAVELLDGGAKFVEDSWDRSDGGGGRTRVLAGGTVFERAGVNYSDVRGDALPPAASARRPDLAGQAFRASGVSLVFHPRNPHAPTTHMNVRIFVAGNAAGGVTWWFGGGFDLTPYYPVLDDVVAWHRAARAACRPFGGDLYERFKRECDDYFYLKHRGETRGVGGLFFDDFNELGFEQSFAFVRSVGNAMWPVYSGILERRCAVAYGARERDFQLMRRGRYVEFNLLFDRGTLFGIQSGGRTESILVSMPPMASWTSNWVPEPGSPEADLVENYLRPRDWLALEIE